MWCLPQPGPGSQFTPKELQYPESLWKEGAGPIASLLSSREGGAVCCWWWSLLSTGSRADWSHDRRGKCTPCMFKRSSFFSTGWCPSLVCIPRLLQREVVPDESSNLGEGQLAAARALQQVHVQFPKMATLNSTVLHNLWISCLCLGVNVFFLLTFFLHLSFYLLSLQEESSSRHQAWARWAHWPSDSDRWQPQVPPTDRLDIQ